MNEQINIYIYIRVCLSSVSTIFFKYKLTDSVSFDHVDW